MPASREGEMEMEAEKKKRGKSRRKKKTKDSETKKKSWIEGGGGENCAGCTSSLSHALGNHIDV